MRLEKWIITAGVVLVFAGALLTYSCSRQQRQVGGGPGVVARSTKLKNGDAREAGKVDVHPVAVRKSSSSRTQSLTPRVVQVAEERSTTFTIRATLLDSVGASGKLGVRVESANPRFVPEAAGEEGNSRIKWLPMLVTVMPGGAGEEQYETSVASASATTYSLLAWDKNGSYYSANVSTDDANTSGMIDAGRLEKRPPTGLVVRLKNPLPNLDKYLLRIDWLDDKKVWEDRDTILRVMEEISPEQWEALQTEKQIVVSASQETRLVPAPPHSLLILQLFTDAGTGSKCTTTSLLEGSVETVELDVRSLFTSVTVEVADLRGRFVTEGTEEPLRGTVRREDSYLSQQQRLSSEGSFYFRDLPVGRTCRFVAEFDAPVSGPRDVPPSMRTEHQVNRRMDGTADEVTWRVQRMRMITTKLSKPILKQLHAIAGSYISIERQELDGSWRPAGILLEPPDKDGFCGLVVPQAGNYRLNLALPDQAAKLISEPVHISVNDYQTTASMLSELSR